MSRDNARRALPGWWPEAAMAVVFLTAVFSQRAYLAISIGERQPGILEVLPVATTLLAVAVTIATPGRALAPFASRRFLLLWGPFIVLLTLLPIIGVVSAQFPLRGLAAIRTPLYAVSAMVIGSAVQSAQCGGFGAWKRPFVVASLAVLSYAVLQQLVVARVLAGPPWTAFIEWDLTTQRAYGLSVILGRSTGFFTNPNILGVWAGIALLVGLFAMRGFWRYSIVGAALGVLVLSQSRGVLAAVIASLAIALAIAIKRRETPRLSRLLPYASIAAAVLVGWYLLVAAGAPAGGLVNRIAEGAQIMIGGTDVNFSGRLQFWAKGLSLLGSHPLGTFGPPEVLLGTAVDSEWVRTLLQGGPLLVMSLALALIGGMLLADGAEAAGRSVRAVSVLLIVAGIAEIPLEYPPAIIYWALVGATLAIGHRGKADSNIPPLRETGAAPAEPDNGRRLLMVATVVQTLDAFMVPHVASLRSAGWQVDGMARGITASPVAQATYSSTWEITWGRNPFALGSLRSISRVRSVVRQSGYGVVHVHTPVAAFITRFALRERGAGSPAIVYTAHGFHFHRDAGWLRNLVYGTMERVAGRWTDELVVVNREDYEAAMARRLVPSRHLHLIRGVGIDLDRFDARSLPQDEVALTRRRHHLPPAAPLLLSVAEINRNKNPGYLVRGFALMRRRDVHLVLAGDGPLTGDVEQLARALGLGDRVHLIGHAEDVPALLKAASVFALVSQREGLPVSMMEAMAMGIPVVGTDTRGIRDLVEDGRGVMVPRDDPDALARALDDLFASQDSSSMTTRARDFVRGELGIDRILADYAAVYARALSERSPTITGPGARFLPDPERRP